MPFPQAVYLDLNSLHLTPNHIILLVFVVLFFFILPVFIMPPPILRASEAVAKERAGRRGHAPAPRHERCLIPDDVPDVSVGLTDHLVDGPIFPVPSITTPCSEHDSTPSLANLDTANSYEAILLGPGENKIDVEVDTRKYFVAHDKK